MSIETGTVYMIDPNTGKQTPISHVSDAEITADTETTEFDDLVKTFDKTREFFGELQVTLTNFSSMLEILFRPHRMSNNYIRLHGGRAIRWRKIK